MTTRRTFIKAVSAMAVAPNVTPIPPDQDIRETSKGIKSGMFLLVPQPTDVSNIPHHPMVRVFTSFQLENFRYEKDSDRHLHIFDFYAFPHQEDTDPREVLDTWLLDQGNKDPIVFCRVTQKHEKQLDENKDKKVTLTKFLTISKSKMSITHCKDEKGYYATITAHEDSVDGLDTLNGE